MALPRPADHDVSLETEIQETLENILDPKLSWHPENEVFYYNSRSRPAYVFGEYHYKFVTDITDEVISQHWLFINKTPPLNSKEVWVAFMTLTAEDDLDNGSIKVTSVTTEGKHFRHERNSRGVTDGSSGCNQEGQPLNRREEQEFFAMIRQVYGIQFADTDIPWYSSYQPRTDENSNTQPNNPSTNVPPTSDTPAAMETDPPESSSGNMYMSDIGLPELPGENWYRGPAGLCRKWSKWEREIINKKRRYDRQQFEAWMERHNVCKPQKTCKYTRAGCKTCG